MPRASTGCSGGSESATRRSSSTCSRAASRITRSSSQPSRLPPVGGPIRILLVEDNEVFRSALELLLGIQEEFEVVGSVGDGRRAAPASRDLGPDVIVMDYRLPGMDGVEATAAVRK